MQKPKVTDAINYPTYALATAGRHWKLSNKQILQNRRKISREIEVKLRFLNSYKHDTKMK